PMRFARQLLCMHGHNHPRPNRGSCGSGVHFDIFAIQPYTTGGPTHEGHVNDVELGDLGKLQTLLRAANRAGRIEGAFRRTPLWITEFSWDSNPPDPGGLPMKIETRWVAEALHQAWSAGVTHFFWYSLRDGPHDGDPYNQTLESGLYFRGPTIESDQPKEVLAAYRYPFVAYPTKKGLSFWGRTPDSLAHKVTIQVWKRRGWRKVAAVRAAADGIFSGVATESRYGSDRRGSARAVYPGQPSIPFSMKPVPDFRQSPFG
ncbi:MAG TPA: hypothetical protein VHL51_08765, partial [Gaiellales bacterium]|nr:hypothetical protein [Gaiellales bacterium]